MTDIFSPEKRSEIMAKIKGTGNTATELRLAKLLRRHRIIGWRRKWPLFGRPDFVFPKEKIAVFVDGEFWHGHPVRAKIPKENRKFWKKKIERNKVRDRLVNITLKKLGWIVFRIWQQDIASLSWLVKLRKLMRYQADAIYRKKA